MIGGECQTGLSQPAVVDVHWLNAKVVMYLPFWPFSLVAARAGSCPLLQPSVRGDSTGRSRYPCARAAGISMLLAGVSLRASERGPVAELSQSGSRVPLGC